MMEIELKRMKMEDETLVWSFEWTVMEWTAKNKISNLKRAGEEAGV